MQDKWPKKAVEIQGLNICAVRWHNLILCASRRRAGTRGKKQPLPHSVVLTMRKMPGVECRQQCEKHRNKKIAVAVKRQRLAAEIQGGRENSPHRRCQIIILCAGLGIFRRYIGLLLRQGGCLICRIGITIRNKGCLQRYEAGEKPQQEKRI